MKALVLSGDAALGAYEAGVALALLEREEFELICVTAGSVIFEMGASRGDVRRARREVALHRGGRQLELVQPGGVFGEMAIVEQTTRSATATAKTSVRLVPISPRRFLYLVQNTPYFAVEVMGVLAARLRRMDEES